jgi:hypothetical protein
MCGFLFRKKKLEIQENEKIPKALAYFSLTTPLATAVLFVKTVYNKPSDAIL